MPDLSIRAAHQYWKQFPDPLIYRVLSFMESVETWCQAEDPDLKTALTALGKLMDDLKSINIDELNYQSTLIHLGNQLKMTQTLRLLQALDTTHPGHAAKLIMYAEKLTKSPQDAPGLFLRRNLVFERLRLLSRVFAPERLNIVLAVLEES